MIFDCAIGKLACAPDQATLFGTFFAHEEDAGGFAAIGTGKFLFMIPSAARRLARPCSAASARILARQRAGGPARDRARPAAAAAEASPAGSTTASPPDSPPGRPVAGFAPYSAIPCAGARPRRSERLRNGPARRARCLRGEISLSAPDSPRIFLLEVLPMPSRATSMSSWSWSKVREQTRT
jgi:hypothetical protein